MTDSNIYEQTVFYDKDPKLLVAEKPGHASSARTGYNEAQKPGCNRALWCCVCFVALLVVGVAALVGIIVAIVSMGKAEHVGAKVDSLESNFSAALQSLTAPPPTMNSTAIESMEEVIRSMQASLKMLEEAGASALGNVTLLQQWIDALNFTGMHPTNPASSCSQISSNFLSPSGYYWMTASNGSAVRVYCDMTRLCGGVTGNWLRVALSDFGDPLASCPDGLERHTDSGIHTCGVESSSPACVPVMIDTLGIPYSKVCGKVISYQVGVAYVFSYLSPYIDYIYVDGVSLTHGSNPRQHIWTFAAAVDEYAAHDDFNCECSNTERAGEIPPAFVGQDYFCDSGLQRRINGNLDHNRFMDESPLWDGAGCSSASTCCSFNNPPWFHQQLPSPTSDDIEMRVCSTQERYNGDTRIQHAEIYVQ